MLGFWKHSGGGEQRNRGSTEMNDRYDMNSFLHERQKYFTDLMSKCLDMAKLQVQFQLLNYRPKDFYIYNDICTDTIVDSSFR